MTALFTRHCVTSDLVAMVSTTFKHGLSLGHSRRLNLIGVPGAVLVAVGALEWRPLLDGKGVDAHVADTQGEKRTQGTLPRGIGLPRRGAHEVAGDIQAGLRRTRHGGDGLLGRVETPQRRQLAVV